MLAGLCRSTIAGPADNKSLTSVKLSKPSAFKGNSIGKGAGHVAKFLLIKFAQWYISKKLWYGIWFVACNQSLRLLIPIFDRSTAKL